VVLVPDDVPELLVVLLPSPPPPQAVNATLVNTVTTVRPSDAGRGTSMEIIEIFIVRTD
jgi:hypothetical protein